MFGNKPNPNQPGSKEFFEAIVAQKVEKVEALLAENPDLIHAKNSHEDDFPEVTIGFGGLHMAVFVGNEDIVTLLVEAGIDIDDWNDERRTPLHVALEHNNTTRDHLIALGAELDVCAAAALQDLERLEELLDSDPELCNDDTTELSPLGWAAYFGSTESIKLLVERGANVQDESLFCAAQVNRVDVGELLIKLGADANAYLGGWDCRPIHAAAAMRYSQDTRDFVKMLLSKGADINATMGNGMTALAVAQHVKDRPQNKDKKFKQLIAFLESNGAK